MPPKKKDGKGKKGKKGKGKGKKKDGMWLLARTALRLFTQRHAWPGVWLRETMNGQRLYTCNHRLQSGRVCSIFYGITFFPCAGDGAELLAEELYKRSVQEVGSLKEQLGRWL